MAFALQTVLGPGEVLPRTFEASEKWPNLIHDPLDQGNCAGSWAFFAQLPHLCTLHVTDSSEAPILPLSPLLLRHSSMLGLCFRKLA